MKSVDWSPSYDSVFKNYQNGKWCAVALTKLMFSVTLYCLSYLSILIDPYALLTHDRGRCKQLKTGNKSLIITCITIAFLRNAETGTDDAWSRSRLFFILLCIACHISKYSLINMFFWHMIETVINNQKP